MKSKKITVSVDMYVDKVYFGKKFVGYDINAEGTYYMKYDTDNYVRKGKIREGLGEDFVNKPCNKIDFVVPYYTNPPKSDTVNLFRIFYKDGKIYHIENNMKEIEISESELFDFMVRAKMVSMYSHGDINTTGNGVIYIRYNITSYGISTFMVHNYKMNKRKLNETESKYDCTVKLISDKQYSKILTRFHMLRTQDPKEYLRNLIKKQAT